MQDVCAQCHGPTYTNGLYAQFDALVNLYNNKFAVPALYSGLFGSSRKCHLLSVAGCLLGANTYTKVGL